MEYMIFSKRIREYRKRMGMTQESLAEKCHMSARQISNIETGKSEPKFSSGLRICLVCGIDINQFAAEYIRKFIKEDIKKGG